MADAGANSPTEAFNNSTWQAVGVTAIAAALIIAFLWLFSYLNRQQSDSKGDKTAQNGIASRTAVSGDTEKAGNKKKERLTAPKRKEAKWSFTHDWLVCLLKGHSGRVLGIDFSPNGKYLASCADDRTVLLWKVREFQQKDHKSLRANVDLDHLSRVRFSPDSKAFIGYLATGDTVRVFRIGRKDDGSVGNIQALYDFPEKETAELLNIGISSNGKYIATFYRDTTIRVWDLKGVRLAVVDSKQMTHTHGCVSPCGRFIASSGFTPDVKIWEVKFDKSGVFQEITRAFELKGHSASVLSFSFNSDSTKMASVSKDGTWRLWNTNVEYQQRQDPYLLKQWNFRSADPLLRLALSPDAHTVAIATSNDLHIYDTGLDDCQQVIQGVCQDEITEIQFSVCCRYLCVSGGRGVAVLHNVVGAWASVRQMEEKRKAASCSAAMKDRLKEDIETTMLRLNEIPGSMLH